MKIAEMERAMQEGKVVTIAPNGDVEIYDRDAEFFKAIEDAEGVLTLADRSNAWQQERERCLDNLRRTLIRAGWTVPVRAQHIAEQMNRPTDEQSK